MKRAEFPKRVMDIAFERAAGCCEHCSTKLFIGKYHFDHIVPAALGGEATLENCRVLCLACHGEKTAKQDIPRIAKTERMRLKHIGAWRSRRPMRRAWG